MKRGLGSASRGKLLTLRLCGVLTLRLPLYSHGLQVLLISCLLVLLTLWICTVDSGGKSEKGLRERGPAGPNAPRNPLY